MRMLVAVTVVLVASVLVGPVAAGPSGQTKQVPAVSPQTKVAQPQIAKLQDPAITKLQEQVAMLVEQDRQKTAQIGQLKYQVGQMQTELTALKTSLPNDYVPVRGICQNSGGYSNVKTVMANPGALLYWWPTCKSQ